MARPAYMLNVVTLQLSPEKCVGCGGCLEVCPHQVFELNGKKAKMANRDACMECGACANNCPTGAISVESGVGCAAGLMAQALGRSGSASNCCN